MPISTVIVKNSLVLLLLGTSGVGKTSVLEYLQCCHSFDSSKKYTTRKHRNTSSDERDFIFCRTVDEFPKDDLLIFQSYNYTFGIQIDQIRLSIMRERNHVLTIGDVETAIELKRIFPDQTKVVLLYCEYNILKSRILSNADTERSLRWEAIDKEIKMIYSWLGTVDFILDCSMPFDRTRIKIDELVYRIELDTG